MAVDGLLLRTCAADTTCAGMNQHSPEEVAALLGDVNELVDNDHCRIDTSQIVSVINHP